jgi:hypothetical protein
MRDDVKLEIMGFDSAAEIKDVAWTVAENLHLSSPSDSALKLAIRKGKGAVEASCRIASQVGIFVAETVCENPIRAVQEIEGKIKAQLDSWKRHRFANDVRSSRQNECAI